MPTSIKKISVCNAISIPIFRLFFGFKSSVDTITLQRLFFQRSSVLRCADLHEVRLLDISVLTLGHLAQLDLNPGGDGPRVHQQLQ